MLSIGRSHLRVAQCTRPRPASAIAADECFTQVVLRKPTVDTKLGLRLAGASATVEGVVAGSLAAQVSHGFPWTFRGLSVPSIDLPQPFHHPRTNLPSASLLGAQAAGAGELIIGHEVLTVNGEAVDDHADATRRLLAACGDVCLALSAPTGAHSLFEDTGRRYQRKAKKEKKRQKKLEGGGDSSSESGGASDDDEADERPVGCVEQPSMRLELVAGPCRGRVYQFGAEGLCIGAAETCGLAMPTDWTVSSLHARISYAADDGGWYLADCGSAGGTFIVLPDAGMRVDAGDLLRIGKTEIVFLLQSARHEEAEGECARAAASAR